MPLEKTFIPYGMYWSSPFCRWQGSFASLHAMELVAGVTRSFLADTGVEATAFDSVVLGMTVPQKQSFYGAPWLAGMIGAEGITGPTVSQACATSTRLLSTAALEVETGLGSAILGIACDRTSNGPHVYYPDPAGPGGTGGAENPVFDNFGRDPWAGGSMLSTAENVAREQKISREEQDEVTLLRHQQYNDSLADDRAFQRRYMRSVEVGSKKKPRSLDADEGVFPTTVEGLQKLRPVLEDGTVTFGSQTHPADGNAGIVVCSRERATELARDPKVPIQVISFGTARVEKGFMPMAVVPAARKALDEAGIGVAQFAAIKSHNPFAVNDVYFCREMQVASDAINNNGSPLIYGHPQGPTGLRAIVELIEELAAKGGGYGLFTGCAAGDTGMAMVLKIA